MGAYDDILNPPKKRGTYDDILEQQPKRGTLGNVALGALKGASDIGATLLTPVDWALNKTGLSDMTNDQRRASLAQFFQENADPESLAFKGGALSTQIAGTAGVGGTLAKGAALIPGVAKTAIPSALASGGFRLGKPAATTLAGKAGNLALRTAGGAAVGGTSAALVNPEDAATGALLGGALPGGAQLAHGATKLVGAGTRKLIGAATGVGDEAVDVALQSGRQGNRVFLDNMRGNADMTAVLDDAKAALGQMRQNRAEAYRQGMAGITKDKTVLDFAPIHQELSKLRSFGSFKGQPINKNAAGTVDEISQQVDNWANLNPAEYHTPEGLDALKQSIGDIRDATQFGTPARRAADQMYNAVKRQITTQAPDYAKTMKQYADASDMLKEVERALSLGEKASADTAMRKLQSLMRNNVNTNFGNRLSLARELEKQGGREILPALAGQAMNSPMPRGLAKLGQAGAALASFSNPMLAASLPFTSPRLMGESLYKLGQAGAIPAKTMNALLPMATRARLGSPDPYLSLLTSGSTLGLLSPSQTR